MSESPDRVKEAFQRIAVIKQKDPEIYEHIIKKYQKFPEFQQDLINCVPFAEKMVK